MKIEISESTIDLSKILDELKNNRSKYLTMKEIADIEGRDKSQVRKSLYKYGIKVNRSRDYESGGQEILIIDMDEVIKYFNLKYAIR